MSFLPKKWHLRHLLFLVSSLSPRKKSSASTTASSTMPLITRMISQGLLSRSRLSLDPCSRRRGVSVALGAGVPGVTSGSGVGPGADCDDCLLVAGGYGR